MKSRYPISLAAILAALKASAVSLVGVIVGVMLVIVGVLIVFLLLRACNIRPRELPDDERYYNPVTDLRYEDLPAQLAPYVTTNYWPPVDVYAQGRVTWGPSNVPSYEVVYLGDFDVLMSTNGLFGNWTLAGSFVGGDTNSVFSNQWATLRMAPDLSGVLIEQSEEARQTLPSLFFKTQRR